MKNQLLLFAAAMGITIKDAATDAEIEAAFKAHKPAEKDFKLDLSDPETKKLFDTAVTAGINIAVPAAVKPLEDKITAQAAEIVKLTGLIANGAAGGAAGGKPVEGAGGAGAQGGGILEQFNAITDPGERTAFFQKNKTAINSAHVAARTK